MTQFEFLPLGYVLSILVETPVLLIGLSPTHSLAAKLFAGVWLTACTYPIVVLAMPPLTGRFYLPIAETFAPVAECVLFATLFRTWQWRDMAAIVVANLASFLSGIALFG